MLTKSEAMKAAIHTAVLRSIHKMGIEKFKQTSFFGSNQSKADEDVRRIKDAA